MKRTAVLILALVLVGTWAFGQTQVLSRNAVGYVKVVAEKGKFHFMGHNFLNIDGSMVTITNLLGDQVPIGSTVYVWDPVGQAYVSASRTIAGWGAGGTNVLPPGRGFWLSIPSGAASNYYDIYLMGEVPDRISMSTSTVSVVSGFSMTGYPFPAEEFFTNTTLAKNAQIGDTMYYWTTNQTYGSLSRTVAGWGIAAQNFKVTPGMGFWYKANASTNWQEPKPYTWP